MAVVSTVKNPVAQMLGLRLRKISSFLFLLCERSKYLFIAAYVCTTPFGGPVVPEVNKREPARSTLGWNPSLMVQWFLVMEILVTRAGVSMNAKFLGMLQDACENCAFIFITFPARAGR